jgi:RloB-like protein
MAKRSVGRSAKVRWRGTRSAKTFARRAPTREPYDVVLIVCEGTKTEPNYLRGLRLAYSLSSTNIIILHGGVTDPRSIVEFALSEMGKDPYDRVYCVFDRDGHQTYDEALSLIATSAEGRAGRLVAITSLPSFEVWLLLHFIFTSSPFAATGSRSAGDNVMAELLKHMADYQKAHKGVFEALASRLNTAIANAKRLERHNRAAGTNNPHTKMHELVEYLIAIKKS